MGCIFAAGWRVVSELVKGGRHVVGHGNVDKFFGVVPFDSEATIKFAFPVGGNGVKVLQGIDEMVGIVFANIFDAKVVDDEAEGDVAALVSPKAGGARRWGVAVFGEVGLESNVGEEAGLFKAVHAFANFNVHPSVRGGEGLQRVLLNDFVGNYAEGKSHVFVPFHGSVEVKIFDVGDHEAGVRGRDGTIEEALGCSELGGGCADGTGVVEAVAANGESGAMSFGFLWADRGNDSAVGNLAIRGNLVFADPANGVASRRHASANSLGQASKFVGKGFCPDGGVRSFEEVTVLLDLAGDWVDNCIGLMDVGE
jgi:hypothetical protein